MKIHEYQGKQVLRKFGVTTPEGFPAFTVDEAVDAARKLGEAFGLSKLRFMPAGVARVVV